MKRLLFLFALLNCFSHCPFAQNLKIDSLQTLLRIDQADTNKVNHLNLLCWEYRLIGEFDSALQYGNTALELSEKMHFTKGVAVSHNNIGAVYTNQGNYDKALENYFASLKIKRVMGDKKGIAASYNNIGNIYVKQGIYEKALENYFASLKIKEEMGDKKGIAASYNNIGVVYYTQGNYDKALENYSASLKIREELGDKQGMAYAIENIGNIYKEQKKYERALENYLTVLKIKIEIDDKLGIAGTYNNIGIVYDLQNTYNKALENYFASLEIKEEIGDKQGVALVRNNIGNMYLKQNKVAEAKKQSLMSLNVAKAIGAKELIQANYDLLSRCDSSMGNWKGAFQYHRLYSQIKDSIFNEESSKQIAEMSTKYETKKKEQEIALLNKDKEKQAVITQAGNRRKNTILWSVGISLFMALVFAGFILRSLRVTQKQKKVIEITSKETEHQKQIIEEKNRDITDSIKYAKRIQEAILPPDHLVKKLFPESFILYKPKDIVCGDFYWMDKKDDALIFAAVDCTGHGVPGAFMSLLGHNHLNQAVNERNLSDPALILNDLNKSVTSTLRQTYEDSSVRDGMDIALCVLSPSADGKETRLQFAGANNPVWLVRNMMIKEIKGDKFPIGIFMGEKMRSFTGHEIALEKGDILYVFSDGYADQFGGEKGKKFMSKNMKDLFLSISQKPMSEQKQILNETFERWRGKLEQVDDVCIIGVRV